MTKKESKIAHMHPEVQKWIRDNARKGGAAGTGVSKIRGTREYYIEMGKRSWDNRDTDFREVAKRGWETRRAKAAKKAEGAAKLKQPAKKTKAPK